MSTESEEEKKAKADRELVSQAMKLLRARVKPENNRRSLEVLRRAQRAGVKAKKAKKRAENEGKTENKDTSQGV